MKLILANNQSEQFVDFYQKIKSSSNVEFDYAAYSDLLFDFRVNGSHGTLSVYNFKHNRSLEEYSGIYINGYLNTYEMAASVAICAESLEINFINKELSDPPSLSKLSMYAKLAAAGISIPNTMGGSKSAILKSRVLSNKIKFPAVLKRADADRGIDNFKVNGYQEMESILNSANSDSIWILQEFIPNDGYFLVSFYDSEPSFVIYRELLERPDKNIQKAHMYKPKGGINAKLINVSDVPESAMNECRRAILAMNRQIASVDYIYDDKTQRAYIIEVNYNPQLITTKTFKEVRTKSFIDNLENI